MIEDYLTYSRGWGSGPTTLLSRYRGGMAGLDPLVAIEHALQLPVSLPACRMSVDPDERHHYFRHRLEDIMTVLLSPDRAARSLLVTV